MCVDAKRKKRGRPKNSSKAHQIPTTNTDSTGSSSAEATPVTAVISQELEPPDQALELSQLFEEYEPSYGEQTPSEYSSVNPLERMPSPISTERRMTPLSPMTLMRTSIVEGQYSIRKQKSMPSSLVNRHASSTSPSSTPKRWHSNRSLHETSSVPIQPIMLQHHQSVQYPGAQHQVPQAFAFQHLSIGSLTADRQGVHPTRISVSQTTPSTSSLRTMHPLSTQFTYANSDAENELRNMPQNR
jgi:hypothetical protein